MRSRRICAAARSQTRPPRAYAIDTHQLAVWASGRGLRPGDDRRAVAAPLRRRAVRAGPCAGYDRAQARRAARDVPLAGGARRAGRESGRPADVAEEGTAAAARAQADRGRGAARPDPGDDAARVARPGAVRARLRLRAARRGAGLARRRVGRLRRRGGARRGQGRQDADRSGRASTRCARSTRTSAAAAPRWCSSADADARALFLSQVRAQAERPPTSGGGCATWARRRRALAGAAQLIRMLCGTRSRRTCSKVAPTCGRSRSCSATPASRLLRSTLG